MKANELRIGNFVLFASEGTEFTVVDITKGGLGVEDEVETTWIEIDQFEGIPLTEEWLVKFGFEKKPIYGWKGNGYDHQPETSKTEYQDYVIDCDDEDYFFVRYATWKYRKDEESEWNSETDLVIHKGSWYQRAEESVSCPKIEYVHQLQNLYFALTGKELVWKK